MIVETLVANGQIRHFKMTVCNLIFVENEHTYSKKMARNGPTTVIYKGTFISNQSLISIYILKLIHKLANLFFQKVYILSTHLLQNYGHFNPHAPQKKVLNAYWQFFSPIYVTFFTLLHTTYSFLSLIKSNND